MKKVVCLLSIALFLMAIICCDGAGVDNSVPSIGLKTSRTRVVSQQPELHGLMTHILS